MRIAFHTLGCKVNQYETEALAESFKARGYEIAAGDAPADVYVINTCTVTGLSDRKSRQYIRRAKKINPESIVAVTGCYAEINPGEAAEIEGVDIVTGNKDKMKLPDYLEEFLKNGRAAKKDKYLPAENRCGGNSRTEVARVCETDKVDRVDKAGKASGSALGTRTRAFIKIQDGCDRFCSYCIVPYARGALRSRPLADISREAEDLISGGCREIVLTGINTALYGAESGFSDEGGLESVISKLNGIPGDFRIRLSSLEPTVINAEYVKKLFKYEKLCRHIHLSAQSGSDKVLKLMNRRYSIDEYLKIVEALKTFDSNYGISTDIIVGFPGESEDDFAKSLEIVEKAGFCRVHVFKYSDRNGTAASGMGGKVGSVEKSRRSAEMIKAGELSARRFFERNSGKEGRVLVEEFLEDKGMFTGYTGNYIKVYINKNYKNIAEPNAAGIENRCLPCSGSADLNNRSADIRLHEFINVSLSGFYADGMCAEVKRKEY